MKLAVLWCDGAVIEPGHLARPEPVLHLPFKDQIRHFERQQLEETLTRTNGNIAAAARLLGMSRSTLFDRLKKLGIRRRRKQSL